MGTNSKRIRTQQSNNENLATKSESIRLCVYMTRFDNRIMHFDTIENEQNWLEPKDLETLTALFLH